MSDWDTASECLTRLHDLDPGESCSALRTKFFESTSRLRAQSVELLHTNKDCANLHLSLVDTIEAIWCAAEQARLGNEQSLSSSIDYLRLRIGLVESASDSEIHCLVRARGALKGAARKRAYGEESELKVLSLAERFRADGTDERNIASKIAKQVCLTPRRVRQILRQQQKSGNNL